MTEIQGSLDGIPLMSPNCWRAVADSLRARPGFRYLEWGSGNSTIAVLRLALEDDSSRGTSIVSVEHEPDFSQLMIEAIATTFQQAAVDGVITTESVAYPKPTVMEAIRKDPAEGHYEAELLKLLWYSRNDRFWVSNAAPTTSEAGWSGLAERRVTGLRCLAGARLHRLKRATGREVAPSTRTDAGTFSAPRTPTLTGPTRVTFTSERVRVEFLFVPQLHNRVWQRGLVLDGMYQQLADYVSVPLDDQFDVILVDGRARVSCLKRTHHDELLAPAGVLFLHDAQRPTNLEGLELFRPWSYIRGVRAEPIVSGAVPAPPLLRSGVSLEESEIVYDRELYYYESPASS